MDLSEPWTLTLSVLTALGLAAACGFRVFVPALVLSLAVRMGHARVAEGFEWIGGNPALVALALATLLEVAAFHVPYLDHLLDALATPAAVVAGALLATSTLVGLDPWLQWGAGIVAGGGAAAAVHVPAAAVRGGSTVTSLGLANPLVATGEWLASVLVAGLSVLVPVLVPLLALTVGLGLLVLVRRRAARGRSAPPAP